MPPKKRTRNGTQANNTAPAATAAKISDDEVDGPATKPRVTRGTAASKTTATNGNASKAAAVKKADTPELSDEEDGAPPAKKTRANGKAATKKSAASKAAITKAPSKASSKKGEEKQVDDDSQDAVVNASADIEDDQKSSASADLFKKPVKKSTKDAQLAQNDNLVVPVDEHSPFQATHRVYISPEGVIFDASLNQTNVGGNNNKFYRIQVLVDKSGLNYRTWTRWGRVGEEGASKILGDGSLDGALRDFKKKFRDKASLAWEDRTAPPKKGKYTFIERSYEPDSSDDEQSDEKLPGAAGRRGSKQSEASAEIVASKLELPVQHLMQLIFNQQHLKEVMADMNYDAEKLPLGKLSKRTIEQGYSYLKQLADLIMNNAASTTNGETRADLSNSYLSTIPHNFGRHKPQPIMSQEQLKREIELLESLSDMKITEDLMKSAKVVDNTVHPLDRQFNGLGMNEMTPLDTKSIEFAELSDYLMKTKGSTHYLNYKIEDIFRIERNGEFDRFDTSPYGKLAADRRLLWHGSRTTNFGGILSQGLRIAPPEAPASGYMFGKGVYLADMSSKSANYCVHHMSGNVGLLLLCEAELGKPLLELTGSDYDAGARAKKQGSLSTWGQGQTTPLKWKDAGCVNPSLKGTTMPDMTVAPGNAPYPTQYLQYNEYIVYDVAQIRLRYLFRVKMA